jgi:hypothetical protein
MDVPHLSQILGATTWITVGTGLLLSAAAYVVMRLYVRAVFRESQRHAGSIVASSDLPALPGVGPGDDGRPSAAVAGLTIETFRPGPAVPRRSPTFQHADAAFRRAATVCALAGSIHAAASVFLLFFFGIYSLPSTPSSLSVVVWRAAVWWAWSIFTFVALALCWGPDRRFRTLLLVTYVAVLGGMGLALEVGGAPRLPLVATTLMARSNTDLLAVASAAVALAPGPATGPLEIEFSPHTQPVVFWALTGMPVPIPLLAFNRPIRATVGPLFINLALVITISTITIIQLALVTSPGLWLIRQFRRAFDGASYPMLLVVVLIISTAVAWLGLLKIAARYRRRQLSDQTFLIDALWLSVSLTVSAYLMGHPGTFVFLLGLAPFALYKVTARCGLAGVGAQARATRNARLLFLRVFGSPARAERLFDLLAARWRYAGSVQLISSTDLARTQFEPDELLDFLSGQLASAFINSERDLRQRLAGLAGGPDADGRYRVNEFFCRADTWQYSVTALMADADLIVMDLRGFMRTSRGCIFELGVILERVPLSRVVLVVDSTTDLPFLRETLLALWARSTRRSAEFAGTAVIGILDPAGRYRAAVESLLALGDERIAAAGQSPIQRMQQPF